MSNDAISRLIELKDEELNGLRLDMERLDQLVLDTQKQLEASQKEQEAFLDHIRKTENGASFGANGMMEHRDFLAHLSRLSKGVEQMLREVEQQRDFAQRALELAYVEKKSFEIIIERKRIVKQKKDIRHQFLMADDEELLRSDRVRQQHGEH
jgi:hypothetical protein